jgi:hypothetical protein
MADAPERQSLLARSIFVDHVACLAAMGLFVAVQLVLVRTRARPSS